MSPARHARPVDWSARITGALVAGVATVALLLPVVLTQPPSAVSTPVAVLPPVLPGGSVAGPAARRLPVPTVRLGAQVQVRADVPALALPAPRMATTAGPQTETPRAVTTGAGPAVVPVPSLAEARPPASLPPIAPSLAAPTTTPASLLPPPTPTPTPAPTPEPEPTPTPSATTPPTPTPEPTPTPSCTPAHAKGRCRG